MSEASEINLNLVTAISGSEQEEKVAALLFSQGCNIIYRALNLQLLSKFLPTSQLNLSIIYSKDFCDANELNIIINKYKQHRFIVLDEKNEQAQLMSALSQINRPPLIHTLERIENLTTVIGSPGAPGISTIANQIAAQISATVICANHHNLRPVAKSKVLNIQAPELNKHLSTLVAGAVVIDAGAVVLLTQTLADRRMNAHWLSESVACASKLIYVINANENGISYLAQFLNDFQKVIDHLPPDYLSDHIYRFVESTRPFDEDSIVFHVTREIKGSEAIDEENISRARGMYGGQDYERDTFPKAVHHFKIFMNDKGVGRVIYNYRATDKSITFLKVRRNKI